MPDLGDFDPVSHYLSSVLSNRKYAEQYSQYAAYYSAAVLGFSLNVATNRFFAIIMSTLERVKRLFAAGPAQGGCPRQDGPPSGGRQAGESLHGVGAFLPPGRPKAKTAPSGGSKQAKACAAWGLFRCAVLLFGAFPDDAPARALH
ncbi:hypothetical protein CSC72_16635 [Pusillimonas noertemannii]|nr:hypothetical protein CSC72_16635 [Pusillimonas noertemannii]